MSTPSRFAEFGLYPPYNMRKWSWSWYWQADLKNAFFRLALNQHFWDSLPIFNLFKQIIIKNLLSNIDIVNKKGQFCFYLKFHASIFSKINLGLSCFFRKTKGKLPKTSLGGDATILRPLSSKWRPYFWSKFCRPPPKLSHNVSDPP